MKRMIELLVMLALLAAVLPASADLIWSEDMSDTGFLIVPVYPESTDCCSIAGCTVQDVYTEILERYYTAVSEQWSAADLAEAGFCFMMADVYGDDPLNNVGYAITDFDRDGSCELLIGVMPTVENEFFEKMLFEMYARDEEGQAALVFNGWDRNRYYYAGADLFANVGSSSAFDSVDTTLQYKDGALTDLGFATDAADYVWAQLQPLSAFKSEK